MMYGQRGLTVRRPRLSPIPLAAKYPAPGRALLLERSDAVEEERLLEADELAGSEVRARYATPMKDVEIQGKVERPAETPEPVPVLGERIVPKDVTSSERAVREDRGEAIPRVPAGTAVSGIEGEKKGKSVDIVETYTMANVAQLRQDFDKALDGYTAVVETGQGTELASAAQYQINILKASADTGEVVDRLRVSAQRWHDFIEEYSRSDLTLSACNEYTHALYLIAARTKAKPDAQNALSAIERCSSLVGEKMPEDYELRIKELRDILSG
jgi:hypothetical protein